ncbi:hypothetical protein Tco_0300687 [Tanacetum coccineum]
MEGYGTDEVNFNPTQIFSVHNWTLKKNQAEGPPFTAHMLAIYNAVKPLASQAPNSSSYIKSRKPRVLFLFLPHLNAFYRLFCHLFFLSIASIFPSAPTTLGGVGLPKLAPLWLGKSEVGDRQLTGPKLIRDTTEKVVQIKNCLLAARSRQKSYADKRAKPLEFEVGDMVLLKNLKKCLAEHNVAVPMDEIQLDDKLHMIKELVEVVDREVKRLKKSWIPFVQVH